MLRGLLFWIAMKREKWLLEKRKKPVVLKKNLLEKEFVK